MRYSKTILCSVVLAITTLFSSCHKNQEIDTYSADLKLSFETTDEFRQLVTRQFEIALNGQTYSISTIEGETFSKTVTLSDISAPATITVKVYASRSASELPESIKFKNTYEIKCTVGDAFAVTSDSGSQYIINREEFSGYLDDMNYTVNFKLNDDGSLSKSVD